MGMYAAQSMAGVLDELTLGLPFELFTHVTQFCGMKVVLLGLYNGQGLENEPEGDVVMYTRDDRHGEPSFVRVLLLRGRLQGAVLIGETGLEETFENLILNRLDVTQLGADILHPEVDDVFD
ncbi:unnamed protein product [Pedinophyceae sp. YPF-701]|nr:unnamed protein product [Pedinophyceae sp. YPF-701]